MKVDIVWGNMPEGFKKVIRGIGITSMRRKILYRKMVSDLLKECAESEEPEKKEIAQFVNKHGLRPYPYEWTLDLYARQIKVYRDEDDYPYYVYPDGKKLFGRRKSTNEKFAKECAGRLLEQDTRSPHCYVSSPGKEPRVGCVIAELGAAEAAFSLEWIDRAKKIYLFECDEEWMIPLQKTFAPYKDKVEIVNKYVGDSTHDDFISIDDFFKNRSLDVIKADIEGFETDMIKGGAETLGSGVSQVYLCAYHRWDDEERIIRSLRKLGFGTFVNNHYMIISSNYKDFQKKRLRRGIIYGVKERDNEF